MAAKKIIYPVFLPHAGCPFQCVYCNQHAVAEDARRQGAPLLSALSRLEFYCEEVRRSNRPGEIAFFGGTFTALPRDVVETILDTASGFVRSGLFTGIRFSTRPDCLGDDIVDLLANHEVRTVELGVQSMSGDVLAATRRGYCAQAVYDSARRVRSKKWDLGIQLMPGLPADTPERFLDSVRQVIAIRPDFVRIYPTLVLEGTRLAEWFRIGKYVSFSLDEAISWVLPAYDLLLREAIPVARMGLHADPALERPGVVLAGPYHPAFGYMVRCQWWREKLDTEFASLPGLKDSDLVLRASRNKISDIIGPKRSNIAHWVSKWGVKSLRICEDPCLTGIEMHLEGYK